MLLAKKQKREVMWNSFYLYDSEHQRENAIYIELEQTNFVPCSPEYVLMKCIWDLSF
jgi:hypothetical protein